MSLARARGLRRASREGARPRVGKKLGLRPEFAGPTARGTARKVKPGEGKEPLGRDRRDAGAGSGHSPVLSRAEDGESEAVGREEAEEPSAGGVAAQGNWI